MPEINGTGASKVSKSFSGKIGIYMNCHWKVVIPRVLHRDWAATSEHARADVNNKFKSGVHEQCWNRYYDVIG